ncbi:MAG: sigma-70 family RNA polymerase sigma factor, partial [Candidatus Poribacteria bacterium]|nr:sigma-70 family RNA polymerase sigma factor [Candidatus Poribacteria bacterium]
SNAVDYDEFCNYLQRAVVQLTPKQREVFILRYKEELPLKEIARKMERSIGTVKAHLFQVRCNLRELILPYLQDNGF